MFSCCLNVIVSLVHMHEYESANVFVPSLDCCRDVGITGLLG